MEPLTTTLAYFSPTGTTRRVVEAVARGVGAEDPTHIDLTRPDMASGAQWEIRDTLLVVGVPVYGGRLPEAALPRIGRLKGSGTPVVLVAVYGNRAYDDALLELSDIASGAGFVPLAAGAFVAEHSFSSEHTPIARGRPDEEDLDKAEGFGRSVLAKLRELPEHAQALPALVLPGDTPYRDWRMTRGIAPVVVGDCRHCGVCAEVCPVAAIAVHDTSETDATLCIHCCACIRICPSGARQMHPTMVESARWLFQNHSARREPEWFL